VWADVHQECCVAVAALSPAASLQRKHGAEALAAARIIVSKGRELVRIPELHPATCRHGYHSIVTEFVVRHAVHRVAHHARLLSTAMRSTAELELEGHTGLARELLLAELLKTREAFRCAAEATAAWCAPVRLSVPPPEDVVG